MRAGGDNSLPSRALPRRQAVLLKSVEFVPILGLALVHFMVGFGDRRRRGDGRVVGVIVK
jgi:hypothetical protein